MHPINPLTFVAQLMGWYAKHRRELHWRQTDDVYKIWLSEVILQQTRVVQGLPYYQKFVMHYPTVKDLAQAQQQEVLHLWQGLGYYTRARNLHMCAQYVVEKLGGVFPKTYTELLQLPGVGPYTAAAVASIAFQERVAVVDGNVYRVLARIFGCKDDMSTGQGKKKFHTLAQTLLPAADPGGYNQAIMEFGALHCTPLQPACATCVFQANCVAYHQGEQHRLPIKTRKPAIKHRYFHYLVIHYKEGVYLKKRGGKDIWQGLYDFYLVEDKQKLQVLDALEDDALVGSIRTHKLAVKRGVRYDHQLTHQRLHICFFSCQATPSFIKLTAGLRTAAGMCFFRYDELYHLPMPVLIKRYCETWLQKK